MSKYLRTPEDILRRQLLLTLAQSIDLTIVGNGERSIQVSRTLLGMYSKYYQAFLRHSTEKVSRVQQDIGAINVIYEWILTDALPQLNHDERTNVARAALFLQVPLIFFERLLYTPVTFNYVNLSDLASIYKEMLANLKAQVDEDDYMCALGGLVDDLLIDTAPSVEIYNMLVDIYNYDFSARTQNIIQVYNRIKQLHPTAHLIRPFEPYRLIYSTHGDDPRLDSSLPFTYVPIEKFDPETTLNSIMPGLRYELPDNTSGNLKIKDFPWPDEMLIAVTEPVKH